MINIAVKRINKCIYSIEAKGHASSGPYGYDLVCAGVSAILIGGINSILEHNDESLFINEVKEGYAYIELKDVNQMNERISIEFETMLDMLVTVQISNSQFIKIEEKD